MVNCISEYGKLAQKEYKSRHDWVVKVIHWELCKRLNFEKTGKLRNQRKSCDNSIVKMSQNTEKSPGDLRTLAVTQTPVKNQLLKLE